MKSKITRTQIADLPESKVELTEDELRLVSGGAKAKSTKKKTNVVTGRGSWDTDSEWDYSPGDFAPIDDGGGVLIA